MLKKTTIVFTIFLFCSCLNRNDGHTNNGLTNNGELILGLKFLAGYPETEVEIHKGNVTDFISDLRKAEEVIGPIKFIKKYKVIVEYKNKPSDTIQTNGTVFVSKNEYFQSKENLIQKFDIR